MRTIRIKLKTRHDYPGHKTLVLAEKHAGLLDGGEISFEVNWLPANVTQSFTTSGLLKDMVDRTRRNFQLVVPAASSLTWTIPALVTKFEPDLPVKGKQKASLTLKVTGKPTLA